MLPSSVLRTSRVCGCAVLGIHLLRGDIHRIADFEVRYCQFTVSSCQAVPLEDAEPRVGLMRTDYTKGDS